MSYESLLDLAQYTESYEFSDIAERMEDSPGPEQARRDWNLANYGSEEGPVFYSKSARKFTLQEGKVIEL